MISKLNYPQIGLFIFAWFIGDLLTPIVIRLAHRIGAVDRPHTYKIHQEPVPFLGGISIFLAFSIALFSILRFSSFEENRPIFAVILGGFLVAILGTIDDFKPISAVIKLVILFGVTWLLSLYRVNITLFGFYWLDLALTLLWIVGVTSATNSIDNMDGAAAGISAIAAFWTFYVSFYFPPVGQEGVSYVAITLFGACLGFLRYNFFSPARIFLGNNGALLMGFLMATLMVLAGWSRGDKAKSVIVPCAILCVPLYDITLATILRIKSGVVKGVIGAIVYNGRDHLSHRLCALGLSKREAVLMMYLFGIVGGAVGMIISREEVGPRVYWPMTAAALLILVGLGVLLDRAKVYPPSPAEGGSKADTTP
ncbi:MAG: undecaprenyl/decaprenyl-phosphate alpha-N-acetylglucosaminyl 1-phosphate transferase [Planctomycetes bacterium]|nr:undecaprenyl/decaprenyl-phosphate alpha-N-acetylglucosaminyl 1-phosphate transferase [Planctomycetota bacterium]